MQHFCWLKIFFFGVCPIRFQALGTSLVKCHILTTGVQFYNVTEVDGYQQVHNLASRRHAKVALQVRAREDRDGINAHTTFHRRLHRYKSRMLRQRAQLKSVARVICFYSPFTN